MGLATPSLPRLRSAPALAVVSMAGLSHIRGGRPNQDTAGVWGSAPYGYGPVLAGAGASVAIDKTTAEPLRFRHQSPIASRVLVVSDGHGSANYDRSARGAALAVLVTLNLLALAADRLVGESVQSRWWDYDLPRKLCQQWRRSVLSDAAAFAGGVGDAAPADTIRRYGATLVATLLTPAGSVFIQLGDGDLTVVTAAGETLRPTAAETPQLGTETESLCMTDAENRCRVVVHPGVSYDDAVVALTSDGVSTSFVDDQGFVDFVGGIDRMARGERRDLLPARVERWIARCSSFSGDDVTAAIALPMVEQQVGPGGGGS